jgi:hypothetical protein
MVVAINSSQTQLQRYEVKDMIRSRVGLVCKPFTLLPVIPTAGTVPVTSPVTAAGAVPNTYRHLQVNQVADILG